MTPKTEAMGLDRVTTEAGRQLVRDHPDPHMFQHAEDIEQEAAEAERARLESEVRKWPPPLQLTEAQMLAVISYRAAVLAILDPRSDTACRCVTKHGVRQPTFGCPMHSPDETMTIRLSDDGETVEEPT